MKEVFFIMYKFAGGGAEKATIILANELVKKGYKVTFLVKENDGELVYLVDKKIKNIIVPANPIRMIQRFAQIFKQNKSVCVFSISLGLTTYAVLGNVIAKNCIKLIPVVHYTINKDPAKFDNIKILIHKLFYKYIYTTIGVSEGCIKEYAKTMGISLKDCKVIYNPVVSESLFALANSDNEHKWFKDKKAKVVVAAGRLCKIKNYKLLIDAIKIAVDNGNNIKLIILGQGELELSLKEYVKTLNLEDSIDFYGFSNNPYSFFSKADCYVLSSDSEALPTVLIEALACGCPVVSTDCVSGPREILSDGEYGKLVPCNNPQMMAEAIVKTINVTANNKEKLINRSKVFGVEQSVDQYLKLIEAAGGEIECN